MRAFSLLVLVSAAAACGDGGGGAGPGPSSPSSSSGGGSAKEPLTIACKGAPTVGNKAPDLTINSLNGAGTGTVASGKVTIIDFWATWCGPCEKSFPKYQDLYVKYKASGLEILAVSVDDDNDKIPSWVKAHGDAKFPVGWDKSKSAAGCFKPDKMPTAVIVDKKGVVRFVHNGYKDGEDSEIEKEVKSLL